MRAEVSAGSAETMQQRQLRRLETLVDSVYALVIVLLVAAIPIPKDFEEDFGSLWGFVSNQVDGFVAPLIGLTLIIFYWLQNNALFGYLERSDQRHATLAVVQLLFVLLYLYTSDLLGVFEDDRGVLALQSTAFVVLGALNFAAWRYASTDDRLLVSGVSAEESRRIETAILPEPITALFTLPFAVVGEGAWNLAWLAFPLVSWLVKRLPLGRPTDSIASE
jgi:uncharacterized membrane protein